MLRNFRPGQRVRVNRDIRTPMTRELLAEDGDALVVHPEILLKSLVAVHHPGDENGWFACTPEELDPIEEGGEQ